MLSRPAVRTKIERLAVLYLKSKTFEWQQSLGETVVDCDDEEGMDRILEERFESDEKALQTKTVISKYGQDSAVKHARIWVCLRVIYGLARRGATITQRDIYYQLISHFDDQKQLNEVLRCIAHILDLERHEFGVIACPRGLVYGCLVFRYDDIRVDCSIQRQLVSSVVMRSDFKAESRNASCILVVEKEGIFNRLVDDGFTKRIPGILVTGMGYPPLYVRALVHKLRNQLNIPVYGLFDHGPHGVAIHLVYKVGSRSMGGDRYSVPDMRFLGLRRSDVVNLNLATHPCNRSDLRIAKNYLSKWVFFQKKDNIELRKEVEAMAESQTKAELQALYEISTEYLAEEFLPGKILRREFI